MTKEVSFQLTPEDLWEFRQRKRAPGRWMLSNVVSAVTSSMVLILCALVWAVRTPDWPTRLSEFAVAAIPWVIVVSIIWFFLIRGLNSKEAFLDAVRKNSPPDMWDGTSITIGPQGVRQAGRQSQSMWKWTAIDHIEDAPNHVLLWIGSASTLIVPKRAFPDPQAAAEFLRLAEEYCAAGKPKPEPAESDLVKPEEKPPL